MLAVDPRRCMLLKRARKLGLTNQDEVIKWPLQREAWLRGIAQLVR